MWGRCCTEDEFADGSQTFLQVFFCSSKLHRKSLVTLPRIVDLLLSGFLQSLGLLDFQLGLLHLLKVFVEQLVLLVQILASFFERGVQDCQGFQGLHLFVVQVVDFGVGLRVFLAGGSDSLFKAVLDLLQAPERILRCDVEEFLPSRLPSLVLMFFPRELPPPVSRVNTPPSRTQAHLPECLNVTYWRFLCLNQHCLSLSPEGSFPLRPFA